jgi:hypothetical protein
MQSCYLESPEDMATQEERIKGLETSAGNARERLAKIEGKLATSSPAPKTTHPILVPFISAVCLALLWYLGWMGTQVVDQGKKLTAIETKLSVLGLQSQASLPQIDFDKALPEIKSTVAAVRKDRISVPPAVIEELRSKLLASNSAAPDFWPTLSEFISYRSALNYHAGAAPAPQIGVYYFAKLLPDCTDSLPKPMTVREVLSPAQAISNPGIYENCRFVLDSPKQDQALNAILRGNTPLITFKNCLIEYRGGEISLILAWDKVPFTTTIPGSGPKDPTRVFPITLSGPAIQFENCLFVFEFQNPPPPNGQRFATTLLAENGTSVSLPVSP